MSLVNTIVIIIVGIIVALVLFVPANNISAIPLICLWLLSGPLIMGGGWIEVLTMRCLNITKN